MHLLQFIKVLSTGIYCHLASVGASKPFIHCLFPMKLVVLCDCLIFISTHQRAI